MSATQRTAAICVCLCLAFPALVGWVLAHPALIFTVAAAWLMARPVARIIRGARSLGRLRMHRA